MCRPASNMKEFADQLHALNRLLLHIGEKERVHTEEFIGARLYTGSMFVKHNAVLRSFTRVEELEKDKVRLCKGNNYTTTLHTVNSAILKMSKIQRAEKVYRGLGGAALPDSLLHPTSSTSAEVWSGPLCLQRQIAMLLCAMLNLAISVGSCSRSSLVRLTAERRLSGCHSIRTRARFASGP